MEWKPLFNEPGSKKIKEKLSQIAEFTIEKLETHGKSAGLMGGKSGVALFLFYYGKYTMEEKYADLGIDELAKIFDIVENEQCIHTFAGGLAGVGWTIEHLAKYDFIDIDAHETLSTLDPILHKAMMTDIKRKNYDYLHGAIGSGLYFLSRTGNEETRNYIKELIDQLDENKEVEEDGAIKWESVLNHEDETKGYNLSLSHGISSIIAFLSKAIKHSIHVEKSKVLLEGAVKYVEKQALEKDKFISCFPSWISHEKDSPNFSRLAWCYGDLGLSTSFWQASQHTGNKELEKRALEILLHSTQRRDIKENSVLDVGLCHGSAGMAHIYNRMYQVTGLKEFKDTAIYWAEKILEMATHEDGFAGFKAWHSDKYGGWVPEIGLLEGIAGIGLALISLISDVEANWDESLLLS
jgi:lantibiotic modifying enzyme